jgi:hypothetical protein
VTTSGPAAALSFRHIHARFGRLSTLSAASLWLVFMLLHERGSLARAISWITVTVMLFLTAGGVVPTTPRITRALADLIGKAAAEAEKALANAGRALHRAVENRPGCRCRSGTTGLRWMVQVAHQGAGAQEINTFIGHRWDRARIEPDKGTRPGTGNLIPGHNLGRSRCLGRKPRELKINNSTEPRRSRRRHLNSRPPTFFRSK